MPDSYITFERYFFWLVVYSVIGWIYECILESFRQHRPVNRGFLNGPYLPIYGSGALLDVVILGNIKNPVILFISSAVITCSLEFLASVILERIFHIRWWDYNDFKFNVKGKEIDVGKFNIQGRICLVGALAFGTLSILLVHFIHPFMVYVTDKFSYPMFHYVCFGLIILVTMDCLFTVFGLIGFNDKFKTLSSSIAQITNSFKDSTVNKVQSSTAYEKMNAACEKFVKGLSHQQLRIIHSFSQLRSIKYPKVTEKIKNIVFRKNIKPK